MSESRPATIRIQENRVTKVSITVYPDKNAFPDEAQIEKVEAWVKLATEIVKKHNEAHEAHEQAYPSLRLLPGSAAFPCYTVDFDDQAKVILNLLKRRR